jgi:hypothetical protein
MEDRLSKKENAFPPATTASHQQPKLEHEPENEHHEPVNKPITEPASPQGGDQFNSIQLVELIELKQGWHGLFHGTCTLARLI